MGEAPVKKQRDLDVLIVGGGSFGTALATLLAGTGKAFEMWVRREELAEEINNRHTNSRYASGHTLSDGIRATTNLAEAVRRAPVILMAVPSKSFRQVARAVGDSIQGDQILVHTTKGFEIETFKRMSVILREETCTLKTGVLSGPNLAGEIMAGHPAGATVASHYDEVIRAIQGLFAGGGRIRVYGGHDVLGTEVGSAFKNIIALAAGASDGMGFGDNTKSLLLTRGLSEMARIGVALGADVFTFGGLTGVGDLMCTCASPLSRNHQVGARLAKGEALDDILSSMTQVAEGVPTTKAVQRYAEWVGLDLPIVKAVYRLLFEDWKVPDALAQLMDLPVGDELAALRYR
jgi:glycerol-3-phosphate dehydrogenase (NAD(P)+)